VPGSVIPAGMTWLRASPKSSSLAWPSGVMRMLDGFDVAMDERVLVRLASADATCG